MRTNNGAIQVSRSIYDSEIWHKPSDWLKIWLYIIGNVNYGDTSKFKRGENYFKYEVIGLECNTTYKSVVNCIKFLKEEKQVVTQKTTRGNIIKVINYDKYQDLDNYRKAGSNTPSNTHSNTSSNAIGNIDGHTIKEETKNKNKNITTAIGIVDYYYSLATKIDSKYRNKSKSVDCVSKLLKKFSEEELKKAIKEYSKGSIQYMVSCDKLFNKNSTKGVYIEDFISTGNKEPKVERVYYNNDVAFGEDFEGDFTPPVI